MAKQYSELDKILTDLVRAILDDLGVPYVENKDLDNLGDGFKPFQKRLQTYINKEKAKAELAGLKKISGLWSQIAGLDFKYVPLPDIKNRINELEAQLAGEGE